MGAGSSSELAGVRVFKVSPGSPASEAGLEIIFDFILEINGVKMEPSNNKVFAEKIQESENGSAKMKVFNTRSQAVRDVIIMPRKWTGTGLLGASVRYDIDERENHGIRVLEVFPNSPAAHAGLVSFQDYLLGTAQSVFHDTDELVQVVTANINQRLQVYVYNSESEQVRQIILVPNNDWGGDGCIGCDIGTGLLHRIPAPRRTPGSMPTGVGALPGTVPAPSVLPSGAVPPPVGALPPGALPPPGAFALPPGALPPPGAFPPQPAAFPPQHAAFAPGVPAAAVPGVPMLPTPPVVSGEAGQPGAIPQLVPASLPPAIVPQVPAGVLPEYAAAFPPAAAGTSPQVVSVAAAAPAAMTVGGVQWPPQGAPAVPDANAAAPSTPQGCQPVSDPQHTLPQAAFGCQQNGVGSQGALGSPVHTSPSSCDPVTPHPEGSRAPPSTPMHPSDAPTPTDLSAMMDPSTFAGYTASVGATEAASPEPVASLASALL